MAKILRGRIAGRYGMESQTAEELHAWADRFERRSRLPEPADDPGWLRRWAKRLRCLAEQKKRARDHKAADCRKHAKVRLWPGERGAGADRTTR
jgi:hypothetical protein